MRDSLDFGGILNENNNDDYNHPLAEVFGFPTNNLSESAKRHRRNRLCPYNNRVPSCTKDKASNPLGVCSIYEYTGSGITITCPIRFRQEWVIAEDAASFFFGDVTKWTSLSEVRLNDRNGESAGNIDLVLVSYDDNGKVLDFGAVEIQAVYISGNVRRPFEAYMKNPARKFNMDWTKEPNYPRPDYLSSSRKRLIPQLIYKGGILKNWRKKTAVVLHKNFFATLPELPKTNRESADIAWLIYDLKHNEITNRNELVKTETIYTLFDESLKKITTANCGPIQDFIEILQDKLDDKLDGNPPDTHLITDDDEII